MTMSHIRILLLVVSSSGKDVSLMSMKVIRILVVLLYYNKLTPVSTYNSVTNFLVHIILVVDNYSQIF